MSKRKQTPESISEARRKAMKKGRFVVVYRDLLFNLGPELSVVIGFLENFGGLKESEGKFFVRDGLVWFPCSVETVKRCCCLTRRKHDRIMRDLEKRGIIKRRMMGNPARRFIAIDGDALEKEKRAGAIQFFTED